MMMTTTTSLSRITLSTFISVVAAITFLPRNVASVYFRDDDGTFQNFLDERRQDAAERFNTRHMLVNEEEWSIDSDQGGEDVGRCKTFRVLLTKGDLAAGFRDGFDDYADIDFGTIQGGKVLLSNPDNETDKIGEYTAFTTFLSPVNLTNFQVDCYGSGAYQFGIGEQIAFSSPCTGLPYFSITGGQGSYSGSNGYVEFMIPDPEERGSFHEIHVCSSSYK